MRVSDKFAGLIIFLWQKNSCFLKSITLLLKSKLDKDSRHYIVFILENNYLA